MKKRDVKRWASLSLFFAVVISLAWLLPAANVYAADNSDAGDMSATVVITIDEPVCGSSASNEPLSAHIHVDGAYTVQDAVWTVMEEGQDEAVPYSGTFKAGDAYYASFVLVPAVPDQDETETGTADEVTVIINGEEIEGGYPDYNIPVTAVHTLRHVPAKAATVEAAGNIEYWVCDGCSRVFGDAGADIERTLPETVVPKLPVTRRGWQYESGEWYYYLADGSLLKNSWIMDSVGWCFAGNDGRLLRNTWAKDGHGWCWLDGNGYWSSIRGWMRSGGEWYYISPNGYRADNTWLKDSVSWCYAGADGKLIRNNWARDSFGWCWLGSDGYWFRNGWISDKGEWYLIKADGYMAANMWVKDSSGWCYASANGTLLKSGWMRDSTGWCWVDANGYWNPGSWRKDGRGWYYCDGTGAVIKNRWMRDSLGWCWVDEHGYYDANKRFYQNPAGMIQICDSISTHGLSYYVSPLRVSIGSDRTDHIEAMISRAYDYLNDPYVVCESREPGKGLDCSGIVMQACYAAGIDLWPSNPARHKLPAYEYESREIWKLDTLESVPWSQRQRGDLVFYANKNGVVIHIAIYLGNDKVIHSYPNKVRVSSVYGWGNIKGVKRVFH